MKTHRPTALETTGLGLTEALSNIARDVRGENLIEAEPVIDDEPPYDIDPDFEARFRAEEKANQADREIYESRADTGDDWDDDTEEQELFE